LIDKITLDSIAGAVSPNALPPWKEDLSDSQIESVINFIMVMMIKDPVARSKFLTGLFPLSHMGLTPSPSAMKAWLKEVASAIKWGNEGQLIAYLNNLLTNTGTSVTKIRIDTTEEDNGLLDEVGEALLGGYQPGARLSEYSKEAIRRRKAEQSQHSDGKSKAKTVSGTAADSSSSSFESLTEEDGMTEAEKERESWNKVDSEGIPHYV